MVKAANRAQQRRALPRSATTIKRGKESAAKQAKQKVNKIKKKKGIHFVNDKLSQNHIQTIIIEILRKWRQCEPKNKNGDPPRGSLAKLVRQYTKTQQWLEDGNKVKMKWKNMSDINKNRINNALPLVETNKTSVAPTSSTKVPGNAGRPIGTTNRAKQELTKKFSQMKNDIALSWVENKLLPADHTNKMSLKQLNANKQHENQLDPDIYLTLIHI